MASTTVRTVSRTNDLGFVRYVVDRLESAGVRTWLFGGWAEELLGLRLPGPHHDVDLLYPAGSFDAVDVVLADGDVEEITAKRFPHKRAFETEGIMVELLLLQGPDNAPFTDFWGASRYEWPSNVFGIQAGGLRVASAMALIDYQATWRDRLPSVDGKQVSSQEWLEHQSS